MANEIDKANEVLADMMKRTLDGLDAAVEFGKQEVPIVVEQLLTWHLVESLVFGLIFVATLPAWSCLLYRFRPSRKINPEDNYYGNTKFNLFTDKNNEPDPRIAFVACGSTVILICFFVGVGNLMNAVKIWLVPKLYLLEYGASLVK